MPNHQLFQHTLQIRELNHLAKQVLAKFNYVNQFIETVPDVTKEEECILADLHNFTDTIAEHKKQYQKSISSYFERDDVLFYRSLLYAAITLLSNFEKRIVQNIPKICLN